MTTAANPRPDSVPDAKIPTMAPLPSSSPSSWTSARSSKRLWGAALLAGSVAVAVIRALTASYPAPKNGLTESQRIAVGRAAAREEPGWREKSRKSFPGDHWSQDDDFHNAERSWVQREARTRQVPISDVLRAIDEDLRAHPPEPPRRANSAQCKPRPFYD